jgi:hypothetical protein
MTGLLTPKSIDVVIAVSFGVLVSVYKLGPLLREITEKERIQIKERRTRSAQRPNHE